MAFEFDWDQPTEEQLNASGRSRPRYAAEPEDPYSISGLFSAENMPLPDSLNASMISRRSSMAPSALYSQMDRQMLGLKSYKRRSKSGTYNVRALDAIVGLAASGYFNSKSRKRKIPAPTTTALGFVNVPTCAPKKSKRKRYY